MGAATDLKHISPLQVGRCHRNAALRSVRKYLTGYSSNPWTISQDETWDFDIKFYQDVVVDSGVTLTVTCTVHMVDSAKFIVKPGGKLVIDGGTLTNCGTELPGCDGLWEGVQVWGNSS